MRQLQEERVSLKLLSIGVQFVKEERRFDQQEKMLCLLIEVPNEQKSVIPDSKMLIMKLMVLSWLLQKMLMQMVGERFVMDFLASPLVTCAVDLEESLMEDELKLTLSAGLILRKGP